MSDQWPTRDKGIAFRDTLQLPRDAALSTLTVLSLRVNEASRGHELDSIFVQRRGRIISSDCFRRVLVRSMQSSTTGQF